MELIKGEIWCDVHGCIHDAVIDPWCYGYAETGQEPECNPMEWRKLWIGGKYTQDKEA